MANLRFACRFKMEYFCLFVQLNIMVNLLFVCRFKMGYFCFNLAIAPHTVQLNECVRSTSRAYVNHSGTVGDTLQIANDLQCYYVCVGSPEPFVISRYRTRELGVNRAQCKIQSQSYFFRKRVGSQMKSTHHSCRNRW